MSIQTIPQRQFENKDKLMSGNLKKLFKILISSSMLLFVLVIFGGCKKNNDEKPVCRVIAASGTSGGSNYHLEYNGDGKVTRISNGAVVTTFEYPADNLIIGTTLDAGIFRNKQIINVNAAGLALNVRTENNLAGTDWTNSAYEYNGDELMKATNTFSGGGSPTITSYTWLNGNMISAQTGSFIEALGYYTDQPRQTGDFLAFAQFIQGFETIRNKNLLKFDSSALGIDFIYEFQPDGNILSIKIISGGTPTFLIYQYECN
jgi:hypothetical protein